MAKAKVKTGPVLPFLVLLANRGNPDLDQRPDLPLPGRPRECWVPVADYERASKLCRKYIRVHGLGMGSWAGGDIWDPASSTMVGYVSYNGRVWAGPRAAWKPGDTPAYEPPNE